MWTDGGLWINFGWMNANWKSEAFRDRLREALTDRLGWNIDPEKGYPPIRKSDWLPQAHDLLNLVVELASEIQRREEERRDAL